MWIRVKIRKTNQEAFINTLEIAALLLPDFSPSEPMKPPGAGVYSVLLKNGSYLEIEPGKAIDSFAERVQRYVQEAQSKLESTAVESVSRWARIWRALRS